MTQPVMWRSIEVVHEHGVRANPRAGTGSRVRRTAESRGGADRAGGGDAAADSGSEPSEAAIALGLGPSLGQALRQLFQHFARCCSRSLFSGGVAATGRRHADSGLGLGRRFGSELAVRLCPRAARRACDGRVGEVSSAAGPSPSRRSGAVDSGGGVGTRGPVVVERRRSNRC